MKLFSFGIFVVVVVVLFSFLPALMHPLLIPLKICGQCVRFSCITYNFEYITFSSLCLFHSFSYFTTLISPVIRIHIFLFSQWKRMKTHIIVSICFFFSFIQILHTFRYLIFDESFRHHRNKKFPQLLNCVHWQTHTCSW